MADTSMLHQAATAVAAAIRNGGPDPAYHHFRMQRQASEWPELHRALATLCAVIDRGEEPPSHRPTVLETDYPELWDVTFRAVWEGSSLPADQAVRVTANILMRLTTMPALPSPLRLVEPEPEPEPVPPAPVLDSATEVAHIGTSIAMWLDEERAEQDPPPRFIEHEDREAEHG